MSNAIDVDGYSLWPGSRKAIAAGCSCPVLDNGHGNLGLARDRGGWIMFSDCAVHGPAPAPIPAQPGSRPLKHD